MMCICPSIEGTIKGPWRDGAEVRSRVGNAQTAHTWERSQSVDHTKLQKERRVPAL